MTGGKNQERGMKMKVIVNSRDITDEVRKITLQEGTENSDAQILKIFYIDGRVETKVSLPFDLHKTHVILKRER